jgi:hypothetical protein
VRPNPYSKTALLTFIARPGRFLCDYFLNDGFRRELLRVLNRGEAVNALKRAIYTGRIASHQAKQSEEMQAVADALSLLANIVMAWNTAQMQQVLDHWAQRRGGVVPPELIARYRMLLHGKREDPELRDLYRVDCCPYKISIAGFLCSFRGLHARPHGTAGTAEIASPRPLIREFFSRRPLTVNVAPQNSENARNDVGTGASPVLVASAGRKMFYIYPPFGKNQTLSPTSTLLPVSADCSIASRVL